MLSSKQKEDIARNKQMVKEIIDVLILCGDTQVLSLLALLPNKTQEEQ
jgi:hypothetical protein